MGKLNYLTEYESKMPLGWSLLQIMLGLETCKTKNDVVELLEDAVELGERRRIRSEIKFLTGKSMKELVLDSDVDCCHNDYEPIERRVKRLKNELRPK